MKRKILFGLLTLFLLPCVFLFSGCYQKKDIDLRVKDGYVQWSYEDDNNWENIISVEEIKETLGESYKGDTGNDGKQIELRVFENQLQWKYTSDSDWQFLYDFNGSLNNNTYCKVSFESNGGTFVEPQNVLQNKKAIKPPAPKRDGYIFDGWSYNGEEWIFMACTVE